MGKNGVYFEPFTGSGALCFKWQPERALLNDLNRELINFYQTVKRHPRRLCDRLKDGTFKNDSNTYQQIRGWDRQLGFYDLDEVTRAARFLYLNKTAFCGLMRYNKSQQMNTPYGNYLRPKIPSDAMIFEVSNFFNQHNITLVNLDFEEAVSQAKSGDFVYFDPPYLPLNPQSFTSYHANNFQVEDHQRLRRVMDELTQKGVKVLLSNSATPLTEEIYQGYPSRRINVARSCNAKNAHRVDEVLLKNY